jgi:hypothetical protein
MYLTNANTPGVGPQAKEGPLTATLYETDTGTIVNAGIAAGALMPTFSPNGEHLVYNDGALNAARSLSVAPFDPVLRTAGAAEVVYQNATSYPTWPFFLPDNETIVFALNDSSQFTGEGAFISSTFVPVIPGLPSFTSRGPKSNLYILDPQTGTATMLARAMGFATEQDAVSGTTTLPFGAAEETNSNYFPTVSPVAAGGYFWVFFDSIRHFGNMGLSRALWATAITISADGHYASDPSHPAFYVPGQEWGTGNHRAFTALDPCRDSGAGCSAGLDCCSGFCTNGVCETPDMPPPGEPPRCSQTDEACSTDADCCTNGDQCLGGFCGSVIR